jgi:hypothetical protein
MKCAIIVLVEIEKSYFRYFITTPRNTADIFR